MTQVVLIRPGATVYDEQNRIQGVLDIPLSERGRAEVAALAESHADRARRALEAFPDGDARRALEFAPSYVLHRRA